MNIYQSIVTACCLKKYIYKKNGKIGHGSSLNFESCVNDRQYWGNFGHINKTYVKYKLLYFYKKLCM